MGTHDNQGVLSPKGKQWNIWKVHAHQDTAHSACGTQEQVGDRILKIEIVQIHQSYFGEYYKINRKQQNSG